MPLVNRCLTKKFGNINGLKNTETGLWRVNNRVLVIYGIAGPESLVNVEIT